MRRLILTYSQSAAGEIRQFARAFWPTSETRVIASYDDFSHGPLSRFGSIEHFHLERQAFLADLPRCGGDAAQEIDLRCEFDSLVKAIGASEKVEVWLSDSVQDVFYAATTMHLLSVGAVATNHISVRHFGDPSVQWGLGAVRAEAFVPLYRSSTAELIDADLYSGLWGVISQHSPELINDVISSQNPDSAIASALSAYLLRFPEFNRGLGSIDRALLGAGTTKMSKASRTVGSAMALGEPVNDRIDDVTLFKRLVELSEVQPDPWFKLEGDVQTMRGCSAQITGSGQEARSTFSVRRLSTVHSEI